MLNSQYTNQWIKRMENVKVVAKKNKMEQPQKKKKSKKSEAVKYKKNMREVKKTIDRIAKKQETNI